MLLKLPKRLLNFEIFEGTPVAEVTRKSLRQKINFNIIVGKAHLTRKANVSRFVRNFSAD